MGRLGMPEMIFIGLVIVLLFGAKKLPEIGAAFGKAIREFRKAGNDDKDTIQGNIEKKDDEQKS